MSTIREQCNSEITNAYEEGYRAGYLGGGRTRRLAYRHDELLKAFDDGYRDGERDRNKKNRREERRT